MLKVVLLNHAGKNGKPQPGSPLCVSILNASSDSIPKLEKTYSVLVFFVMLLRLCYKHMIQPLIEMSTYSLKRDRLEVFGEETGSQY